MEAVSMSGVDTFRELRRRGYTLSPTVRTEVREHKAGAQVVTYGHRLRVAGGPGPLKGDLREAVKTHQPLLLAAACVTNPPVPWLAEMLKRSRNSYSIETKRLVSYRKRDGTVGHKTAPVTVSITPETVAANVASFIGLHPVHDRERLLPIIREALQWAA
jgi:hypothetical protein